MTRQRSLDQFLPTLFVTLLPAIGLVALACSSGSSPTEPDTVASAANPDSASSSGSSSGDDSSGGDTSDSGTGDSSGGSGSADSPSDTGSSDEGGQQGSLTINLTDVPTEEICQLWVHFAGLRVKPDGDSAQVIDLGFDPQAYDLLTLQNGNLEEMGEFGVPQGKYQFIEILLDEDLSSVVEKDPDNDCSTGNFGETVDLQIPSEKFKVRGNPFTVDEDTEITIDFDADESLKRKGSSKNPKGWQLNPSVRVVNVNP